VLWGNTAYCVKLRVEDFKKIIGIKLTQLV